LRLRASPTSMASSLFSPGIMVVVYGIIVVHPSRLHGDCRRVCRTSH
jgi:hypothetical protein